MKEVLYTISGKRLPVVMNIGARALTSQGLNVHAGHDDVMSVADCGWGMLFARNAQEAGDFCLIARRAAEASQTPFFNVQDGFLTTHTVETRAPARARVHEGVHRRPEDEADQPDGPGQPADVGRRAEPGLVHEGQDRPALVLRPRRAGPGGGLRRVLPQDRPPLRLRRALPLRGRRVHPRRHGLLHGDGQGDGRLPARRQGHRRRLPDRVRLPAVPGQADRRGPEGLQGVHRLRADGRPALDHRQPPDPRDQGGLLRRGHRPERPREDRPRAADLQRRGRPGQPRRPARRHHRRVRQHDPRRPGFLLRRHRPSAGAEARRGPRPAAHAAASRCAATRSAASAR